jgi:chemotaxis protein MotB
MNKNKNISFITAALLIVIFSSCVPKRKYLDSQIELRYLKNDSTRLAERVQRLREQEANLKQEIDQLNEEKANISTNAANTQNDLQQQLKGQQQRSQQLKNSLDEQRQKAQQLQALLDAQKQKAEELRKKMSEALGSFNSNELTVSQKNGKVYVSLQESLLFPSGSAVVNAKGKDALNKLADVLNANPDISVNIEGHTDSIPITKSFQDNWALSVARAVSIVRILTNEYHVDPTRVIASGHSQYDPVDTNSTPEGRAKNRRTEIILSPKLDELYKLLEQ